MHFSSEKAPVFSKNVSISHCLRNFSNMETLSGDQKYLCDTCGSKQATRNTIKYI